MTSMSTRLARIEGRDRGALDLPPIRRLRLRIVGVVGLLVVYTVGSLVAPALQVFLYSPDLRIVIEAVGLCITLFTVLALLLPGDQDVHPARNAVIAGLVTLGVSNALFGVGPILLFGETASGSGLAFYPWATSRYVAGLLFIVAGLGWHRRSLRSYLLSAAVALATAGVTFLLFGDRLPLPLALAEFGDERGGMAVRIASLAENAAIAVLPGVLFGVGAWLGWRVFLHSASQMYLWLSVALWVQALAQAHEVLYPAVLGPVITSADLLRFLALGLLLVGALLKVRRLVLDRTAAVQAQAEDLRSQEQLLSAMRAFTEREEAFRSIVVHELSTPIATLRTFAHVLLGHRDRPASEGARAALDGIRSESGRLQELAMRMDELRHLESDDFDCALRPVRLAPLLDDAARYVRALSGAHEVMVTCDDVRANADPVRLSQALRNVLNNAAHYSPEGSPIRVECRTIPEGIIEVTVVDQGPGVLPHERERVLGKYERGSAGHDASGAGLGLYVARRIMEAHEGRLFFTDARESQGARAVLQLRPAP